MGWFGDAVGWVNDNLNPFKDKQPDPNYLINANQFGPGSALGQQLTGLMGQGSPYMQGSTAQGSQVRADPYSGDWGGLIAQLRQQASGTGPSLAQEQYRNASQDSMSNLSSMAQGSANPAAAREAMLQQGRVGQGMASGLAQARTQEQMAAVGQLGGALQGAGNAAYQRDALNAQLSQGNNQFNASQMQGAAGQNQAAWLQMMATQLGLSSQQLQALLGNQNYAATISGQPTGLQRGLGMIAGIAGGAGLLGGGHGGGK